MPLRFLNRFDSRRTPRADPPTEPSPPVADPLPDGQDREEKHDPIGYVTCASLLDPKKQVIGYRMAWRPAGPHPASADAQLQALGDSVRHHFCQRQAGWRMGNIVLFFDVAPGVTALDWCEGLPAQNVVLCWQYADFLDPQRQPTLASLRERGFGLMLCGATELPEDKPLRELVTHFDVGAGDPLLITNGRRGQPPGRRPIQLIATRMEDWPQFEACAARRVPVMVDGSCGSPPVKGPRRALQPESLLIVALMQMLQRNEDVREIEAALKHDAALTYRLLRHINSPAISAGVEITSLRHAVSMLGYSPLFRWLSLLLATSNAKVTPPFLMKKAIMRGRFVELLGQTLLGPNHSDNLFLVGMFSFVDQLLGISMTDMLEKVQLAEPVQRAILEREGIYGPFLALALACESDAGEAAALAEALFVSANQVNAAHLLAMVWSQEIARVEAPY